MILKILGIVFLWFILGWVINFMAYNDKPISQRGTSDSARFAHYVLNIGTIIWIIAILVS